MEKLRFGLLGLLPLSLGISILSAHTISSGMAAIKVMLITISIFKIASHSEKASEKCKGRVETLFLPKLKDHFGT